MLGNEEEVQTPEIGEVPIEGSVNAREILDLMKAQLATSQQQSTNIDKLGGVVGDFAVALRTKPSRRETFGIVGIVSSITLVAVFGMFVFLLNVASDAKQGADNAGKIAAQIQDCFDPNGRCAQVSRQANEQNRLIISLRSEQLRLESLIQIQKTEGDGASQKIYEAQLTDITRRIAEAEAAVPKL